MKLSNIDICKWFNTDEYTLGFVADFDTKYEQKRVAIADWDAWHKFDVFMANVQKAREYNLNSSFEGYIYFVENGRYFSEIFAESHKQYLADVCVYHKLTNNLHKSYAEYYRVLNEIMDKAIVEVAEELKNRFESEMINETQN